MARRAKEDEGTTEEKREGGGTAAEARPEAERSAEED